MNAYYNEIDTYCSKWLERLISSNVLPQGIVDNRSIIMANYVNLGLFNQCHFFAGIGGWPLALRMSNWPKDEPIWTGSCPCQPFSIASPNRSRTADDRHQWPNFFQLIEKHRPSTVFGEQVAGMDGLSWFTDIRNDLEGIDYAVGAANLPAIGAPHRRSRIFWVAHSSRKRLEGPLFTRERLFVAAQEASAFNSHHGLRTRFNDSPNPASTLSYHGISRPMDIVRAFGNSIVPQTATIFINLITECL